MADTLREPTTAEIEATLSRIREFAAAQIGVGGGVFHHDSVRLVWPIAYAAGVRDQEAEDFAELNHMSTQCDRANEVAANAEERHERVVKALAGMVDEAKNYFGAAIIAFRFDALVREAEAALKEAQDALRAHERSEHGADPELLH